VPSRILVIEDNAANLDLMVYLLGAYGNTVYAAKDGEEGLEKAAAERPDLVVCDIHLPKLDGYGVIQRLKADPVLRGVPVIAVTALAMVGDRDRVLQAGFDGYVSKPIDPERFIGQIQSYLKRFSHLPAASYPSDNTSPAPRENVASATVLAVDNVPYNLELVRSLLGPFGYRVITAASGNEGIDKARRQRPDLILSDVCMEDGSGFDFIQSIKSDPQLSTIPFVFITSSMVEEKDRAKGLALGAARFLVRPIDAEKLLAEVSAVLPKPADRDNNG